MDFSANICYNKRKHRKRWHPMKALLVGINSKYIHTNLALRDIYHYGKDKIPQDLSLVEFTINQRILNIVDEIYREKADILLFSCYIWNISWVCQIVSTLRKIAPHTTIVLGGPEVSYHAQAFLAAHPAVDAIMVGEGEGIFPQLMCHYAAPYDPACAIAGIQGVVHRTASGIVQNPDAPPFDMASLPFPYADLNTLHDRILYFESSRGCPFGCSYCLSSVGGNGVRFLPLSTTFAYLSTFLERRVRQVKFVDRTFNCNKAHALAIWKFLHEHDNGVTNFHFEISAHLLDRETLDFLRTVRPEQFQLEVGVQSTNPQTIDQIGRSTDTQKLLDICAEIDRYGNIHQHLDLIAGLPHEDIASFAQSFNQVFAMRPQQLQLGFLKILKGSRMEREVQQHGMTYNDLPPFEILGTKWLSYDDILRLKGVESMVEQYYNSGRFFYTLQQLLANHPSPYDFFEQLGVYFYANQYHQTPLSKEGMHTVLKEFYEQTYAPYTPALRDVTLFDLCLKEKPKKFPEWLDYQWNQPFKAKINAFYVNPDNIAAHLPAYVDEQPLKISRLTHLQAFTHDVTQPDLPERPTFLLFDYAHPNLHGHAQWQKVTL